MPEIRRLLIDGKNAEAEALVYKNFTAQGAGSARGRGKDAPYGSYQVLGDLKPTFPNDGAKPSGDDSIVACATRRVARGRG